MKRMKIGAVLSCILAFVLCISACPVMADPAFSYHSEISYPPEVPDGTDIMDQSSGFKTGSPYWKQFENNTGKGLAQIKQDPKGSGNNCIYVKGSTDAGGEAILRGYLWGWCDPMSSQGANLDSVCFEYRFLYRGSDEQYWIGVLNDGSHNMMIIIENGKLKIGDYQTDAGVAPDTWYDLKIYFDFENKCFRAYLDGWDITNGVQYWVTADTLSSLEEIYIFTKTNDPANPFELYVERISVNNLPDQPVLVGKEEDGLVNSHFPTSKFTVQARTFLAPESVTLDKFSIDGGATIQAVRLSDNNSSIEFDLCDLKPDTSYTITINDGVTTSAGEAVESGDWTLKTLPRANYSDIRFTDGDGTDISQTGLVTGNRLNLSVKFYDYSDTAGDATLVLALYNNGQMVGTDIQTRTDIVRFEPKDFLLGLDVPVAEEGDNYKAVLYFLDSFATMKPYLRPIVLEPGSAYYTRP